MSLSGIDGMIEVSEFLRKTRNANFDDEEARKKAKRDDEDREFDIGERKRKLEIRSDLEQAAAPATVEPGIYQPEVDDEGNAMPANPSRAGVVNGKGYATMADVEKAKAAYNAPEAVTTRMSDVLMRRADPEGAQKLRTGAMNEKVAGLKLTGAEREEAQAAYLDDLQKKVPFGNWKAMADFASNSKLDGADGKVKYEWRPSQDGAAYELFAKADDLPWAPTGTKAANTSEGFAEQLMHLQRLPIDKVLAHLDRKQARADNQAYRTELLKDKDEAAAQRKQEFDARMTMMRERGAGRGAGGAGGDTAKTVDPEAKLKDRRDALADFDKLLPPIEDDADEAARVTRTQLLAQADGIFQLNAESGMTLTAPQIRAAMAQSADPSKRKVIRDADTGQMFEAVIVNGRPVIVGVVRGAKPAGAAPAPGQPQPEPGRPTAQQPAAAPPSMRELLVSTSGSDRTMQAIMAAKAPAIEQAVQAHQQAKQQLRAAAASGDPRSLTLYAKKLQEARAALEQATAGVPQKARQQALAMADQ